MSRAVLSSEAANTLAPQQVAVAIPGTKSATLCLDSTDFENRLIYRLVIECHRVSSRIAKCAIVLYIMSKHDIFTGADVLGY